MVIAPRFGDPGAIALDESAALLVAGADPERPARARALVQAIGQLDQTLRSTRSRWAIRRLTPVGDERMAPTRVGIKHALEAMARQTADVVVVAIAGTVTSVAGEPALITGATYRGYPDEATLPLRWIGQRLAALPCARLVALVSARADEAAPAVAAWLAALAPPGTAHAVFVEADEAAAAVAALALAFRGGAVDLETGTVTSRSLGNYLARAAPETRARAAPQVQTLVRPASLDDLRALGWTRPAVVSGAAGGDAGAGGGAGAFDATDRSDGATAGAPAGEGVAVRPGLGAVDELSSTVLRGEIRVDEVLARGSFGVVYRARQLWMGRDVALKVLPPGIDARSEEGQMFLDEVRAVARIDHPHVVRVLHADETYDGRLFFAMELLAGEDLDRLSDRGPVPPARAIALVIQLLAGLAAAHAAGLIHADIKPGNGFVARSGDDDRVVLLDFGLARLVRAGAAAASAGGTPQYMAPEQLTHRRIDERSDLFSAGLVLFTLLTGWRRRRASEIVPPLELIEDAALRAVLARALALEPAARYPSAAAFALALGGLAAVRDASATVVSAISSVVVVHGRPGVATGSEPDGPQPPPFRRLRSFSERDRDRFFGRDREVAHLLDHVLQHAAVIYTAPSGVGKTSLLRAGLLPRLEALGGDGIYVACHAGRSDPSAAIVAALGGGGSLAEAWARPAPRGAGRRVLVIDQIEAVLAGGDAAMDALAQALLGRADDGERDRAVVLSVREDFLGRLVDRLQPYAPSLTILRLPPLSLEGARAALVRPFTARRLGIDDDLLAQVLADLAAAAASLGAEMGWGAAPSIYPPHLQLAGARLHEALPDDATTVTLRQYQQLGGIDEIVRSHLAHVLESELAPAQVPIAREAFKHLITPAQTRASPTETELIAAMAGTASEDATIAVLEELRRHGLVVRLARGHREASWELIHDSLIPRIQAWMDDHDLARRRAMEMLRHHARQSRPEAPSLLSRAELRALHAAPDVIDVVEREWRDRAALPAATAPRPWTPVRLIAHARATHRRRRLAGGLALGVAVAALIALAGAWWRGRQAHQLRQAQIATNLGRFRIELVPFDWDPERRVARGVPIAALPGLRWTLHEPDPMELHRPGPPMTAGVVRRSSRPTADGLARVDQVEAPGRAAVLVVEHRGHDGEACAPSIVPIRALPGYAARGAEPTLRVAVPTCRATRAGTVDLPAGPFVSGDAAHRAAGDGPRAVERTLPRYAIDRTEVTNAAFALWSGMAAITGLEPVEYPTTDVLGQADGPAYPVAGVTWQQARAYCGFLGKRLPSALEWEKALRGGLVLADGTPNPAPARALPWAERVDAVAKLAETAPLGPAPVASFPDDRSPDGVYDLAGNVAEWSGTAPYDPEFPTRNTRFRAIRGGSWETPAAILVDTLALLNPRPAGTLTFSIGLRCVVDPP